MNKRDVSPGAWVTKIGAASPLATCCMPAMTAYAESDAKATTIAAIPQAKDRFIALLHPTFAPWPETF
jgi:hypothetical protein